jgi:hypothetical protein
MFDNFGLIFTLCDTLCLVFSGFICFYARYLMLSVTGTLLRLENIFAKQNAPDFIISKSTI